MKTPAIADCWRNGGRLVCLHGNWQRTGHTDVEYSGNVPSKASIRKVFETGENKVVNVLFDAIEDRVAIVTVAIRTFHNAASFSISCFPSRLLSVMK